MTEIRRWQPTVRMHQAVAHGGLLFTAGQCAEANPDADAQGQAEEILGRIDRLLADAGTDKSRILSASIYLADMSDFAAMNRAWDAWVAPGEMPARTTIEAKLTDPRFAVEIGVIAAL
ncbi:RidA family protein [Sphingomonas sp. MG17]|uniref:RidA family protein n=1 Tax=Sphingomonas tagetis TaxID=2949092 RepID=A0A9X2KNT8_9SPHN|nr:RidA family protein [Sphingomonas tagetis]MCP3729973.1 RidA family protein [Sphingomonas tagetis]